MSPEHGKCRLINLSLSMFRWTGYLLLPQCDRWVQPSRPPKRFCFNC